jgi:hypothetical protein
MPASPASPGYQRQFEAVIINDTVAFQLIERAIDLHEDSRGKRQDMLIAFGPMAYDILSTGYDMAEEDQLGYKLEQYSEQSEKSTAFVESDLIVEVEEILEAKFLSPAERLRTKIEIGEFLEGRLEPNVLIARCIQRQRLRENCQEHLGERQDVRVTIGQP